MNILRCFRMTRLAQLLTLLLALIVCGSAHAGFDAKYKAFRGDFNSDGFTDLFLTRAPDLVMVALDDLSIPIVRRRADHLVLLQGPGQTFTVDDTLSAADLSTLRAWAPASSLELVANDINIDGQIDLFIGNLKLVTGFPATINDQIVFYASDATDFHVRAVDATFKEFFKQIVGWDIDHDYFVDTAIANHWYHYNGQVQTGWWYISYINQYYAYDSGQTFLDESDDPSDPSNVPAYSKAGIVICALLVCSERGETDDWITWRDLGYEWAIEDIRLYTPDESGRIYVVVGEGEGYNQPYIRIPRAARAWGAIYLSFGIDPKTGQELPFGATPSDWNDVIERTVWTFNRAWLNAMMAKQAHFYDIGNYAGRNTRAKFYACERRTLQGYPLREERTEGDTVHWTPAPCVLLML